MLVRFAPSPTGLLHVGNLRTALANYLFAKSQGGQFMLRIDDTDTERSKAEYEEGLKRDLEWMGLQWDVFAKQSDRFDKYEEAKQQLIAAGRLYACYETAEELDVKRKLLISRGLPPLYDRSALTLTDAQKAALEAEGRRAHWRFKMNAASIVWQDMIRGEVKFDGAKIADPVLFREDGVALFTLSTSVDDGQLGITHIIRGEDHVSNTAVQVQVMEALGYAPPVFGHMALLKMKEGKISKRAGGGDVQSLREGGIFPLVLASYLAKIGTSDAIELAPSMEALAVAFDTGKLGRAMANYDPMEVERLNHKYFFLDAPSRSAEEATKIVGHNITSDIWMQIASKVHSVKDILSYRDALSGENAGTFDTTEQKNLAEYCKIAASIMPEGDWNDGAWDNFVSALKEKTGKKGKELFMPLRMVLTGGSAGAELKDMFLSLGRDKVKHLLDVAANPYQET